MREYMFYCRCEIRVKVRALSPQKVENIAQFSRDYFRDPIISNDFVGFILLRLKKLHS
jgi:hypothetical protein